jgi:hypothetical protein
MVSAVLNPARDWVLPAVGHFNAWLHQTALYRLLSSDRKSPPKKSYQMIYHLLTPKKNICAILSLSGLHTGQRGR